MQSIPLNDPEKQNQFLRRATKERTREVPIIKLEVGRENAVPASGEGAGAIA